MLSWRHKYCNHRGNAARRGVPFLLSFDEWMDIWSQSGHMHERGQYKGQYVMARYGDIGPYAVGNVRILTVEENRAEQKCSHETRAKMSKSRRGNKNSFERKDTSETRERKRAALMGNTHTLGRKATPEQCAEQSLRSIKMWADPERRERQRQNNLGKTLSVEHRAKISAAHVGKVMSPESREKMRIAKKSHFARKKKMQRRQYIMRHISDGMALPLQARRPAP